MDDPSECLSRASLRVVYTFTLTFGPLLSTVIPFSAPFFIIILQLFFLFFFFFYFLSHFLFLFFFIFIFFFYLFIYIHLVIHVSIIKRTTILQMSLPDLGSIWNRKTPRNGSNLSQQSWKNGKTCTDDSRILGQMKNLLAQKKQGSNGPSNVLLNENVTT